MAGVSGVMGGQERHILWEHGLDLVTQHLSYLNPVTDHLRVDAGVRYEPAKQVGLAHVLESCFFQGISHDPLDHPLTRLVERLGRKTLGATRKDSASYWLCIPYHALSRLISGTQATRESLRHEDHRQHSLSIISLIVWALQL